MDGYEWSGYLVTEPVAWDLAAERIVTASTFDASLAAVEITVSQDTDGDGTADNEQTVALESGNEDHALTAFETVAGADYWLRVDMGSNAKENAPEIDYTALSDGTRFTTTTEIDRTTKTLIEPPATAIDGSGSAIQLLIDGIIDREGIEDGDFLESEITYQDDVGVPLRFEFDWQEADTEIDEWPVTLESTFAVAIDDPSILDGFDINALGADCTVEAEIKETTVSSTSGLMFVTVEWIYYCPTDIAAEVKMSTTTSESTPATTVATNPTNGISASDSGSGGSGTSSASGSYRSSGYTRPHRRSATVTGLRCTPPNEADTGHVTIHYTPSSFQSYRGVFSFDPAELQVDAVHADDSIFTERNERSTYTYEHRMAVDSATIDNDLGRVEIEASAGSPISMGRNTKFHDRIMTSLDVTAVGSSGTIADFEWSSIDFFDGDGNELTDISQSGTAMRIDNGITVESIGLDAGETAYSQVYGRIGETFADFRTVMRLNPDVVADLDVRGDADLELQMVPSQDALDDETRENQWYAVVDGSFAAADRMRPLFEYAATGYSAEQLLERADLAYHEDDVEMYPSSTSVTVLDRDDVELLNAALADQESDDDETSTDPIYDRDVRHIPDEELPLPYLDDPDNSLAWGCSKDGTFSHQSAEFADPCGDSAEYDPEKGWCIPEFGVVYWPLVFDIVVEVPGVYPDAVEQEDIRVETWSETNPAITHAVGELVRGTSSAPRTLFVPLTIVIPKADDQEYPVNFDFAMWIGGRRVTLGGNGLHVGGDVAQGDHAGRVVGGKIKRRFGVGGGPF